MGGKLLKVFLSKTGIGKQHCSVYTSLWLGNNGFVFLLIAEVLVLYDYDGQADDELTIRKGDVILDVKKMPGGWWEGQLGSKRGVFPDNFVSVIRFYYEFLRFTCSPSHSAP